MTIDVETFFHKPTFTLTHLLIDRPTRQAAIIDPVLDYDAASAATSTDTADRLIERIEALDIKIDWILETHVHADHLTSAPYLKDRLCGTVVIGHHVPMVQETFAKVFDEGPDFATDGSQFDKVVAEGDKLPLGEQIIEIIETPGHTPACISYLCDGHVFVGDTLFAPDYGTARCDFPGGDAGILFDSIQKLFGLAPDTVIHLCHDYMPEGRPLLTQTPVEQQKQNNIHIGNGRTKEEFIKLREQRDSKLSTPALMLPSVQVNMRAGHLPEPHANGIRYLKLPLNTFGT